MTINKNSQKRNVYKHPMKRSRCFVLDNQFEFARFYYVKTKAFSYAFYVYVSCPLPPLGAFSNGKDMAKINNNFYLSYINKQKHCFI